MKLLLKSLLGKVEHLSKSKRVVILDAFMKEDDIHIAYPTQQININKTDNAYGSAMKKREKPKDLEDDIIRR